MALLTSKKNTAAKPQKGDAEAKTKSVRSVVSAVKTTPAHPVSSFVLGAPRITEKASMGSEHNVYTFTIPRSTGKADVAAAVRAMYGVVACKVHVSTIPRKKKFVRGKKGKTALGKKAYVYLKKGDTIESL